MPAVNRVRAFAAGFAGRDITPAEPALNYKGVRLAPPPADLPPLECLAAVFCTSEACVALVAIDTIAVGRDVVLMLRERAALDPRTRSIGRIIVAATHTHCAPSLAPMFIRGAVPDPMHVDRVIDSAIEALAEAMDGRQRVGFAEGVAAAPGLEHNRRLRRPDGRIAMALADDLEPEAQEVGPVDRDVPFWLFTDRAGKPIGLIYSYPCHNNAARADCFSPDIAGGTRQALRRALGPTVMPIMLAGACGDVTWMDPFGPRTGGLDVAEAHGQALAAQLLTALDGAPPDNVLSLHWARHMRIVPDRSLAASVFDDDGSRGASEASRVAHRQRYEPERAAVAQRGDTSAVVELGLVTINNSALVSNPAELFTRLGLAIRSASPFAITMISELTNGYVGYVPGASDFELGGYETWRTVYTSRLAQDAGPQMVAWALDMLKSPRVAKTEKWARVGEQGTPDAPTA